MGKQVKLSAAVIARNEESKIGDCVKSLNFADEVIVVVNEPYLDKTGEIASKLGAKVYKYSSVDFSDKRNYAMDKARGEWVLYVDADERVTPELADEIASIISDQSFNAYAIPRRNIILGKELKHGGQYPDYVKRLFKKSEFKRWTGALHEEPNYMHEGVQVKGDKGNIGYLKHALIHTKHSELSEMVEKTNAWSEVEAKLMYDAGHPPMNIPRFLSAMAREFFLRMIKQKAFMDGNIGIIYGLYQVFSRFVSYAKLWEMQLDDR